MLQTEKYFDSEIHDESTQVQIERVNGENLPCETTRSGKYFIHKLGHDITATDDLLAEKYTMVGESNRPSKR